MTNRLLARRQMVVDVIHPTRANVSKGELRDLLAGKYGVSDPNTVFLRGFRTVFGGGRSSGFCLIYDDVKTAKKFVPKFMLARHGMAEKTPTARKQKKERKNRGKKIRGTKGTHRQRVKK